MTREVKIIKEVCEICDSKTKSRDLCFADTVMKFVCKECYEEGFCIKCEKWSLTLYYKGECNCV